MPTNRGPASGGSDAEHRRWLIGVGISVVFGLFGAVMAWLSYCAKTRVQQVAPSHATPPHDGAHEDRNVRRRHGAKD